LAFERLSHVIERSFDRITTCDALPQGAIGEPEEQRPFPQPAC
jgi:hypothetical protein